MATTLEIGKKTQKFLEKNDKEGSIKIITENALKNKLEQLRQNYFLFTVNNYLLTT